ncbi:hypothetical protein [uncultured Pelagimonas sp.]|uniref:hypothetical protein n=1 Tax=uncultured Pelagimonas sp. TaxID=1618102 RepID=UPI0026086DD5|nr:hypothetical protein [uncultured Pelagimonas sp.]
MPTYSALATYATPDGSQGTARIRFDAPNMREAVSHANRVISARANCAGKLDVDLREVEPE